MKKIKYLFNDIKELLISFGYNKFSEPLIQNFSLTAYPGKNSLFLIISLKRKGSEINFKTFSDKQTKFINLF